ncbi:MAG: hypothetical protein AAF221_07010 [Pseudomonadota bacterium]
MSCYENANKAWMTSQMLSDAASADRARGGGYAVSSYVGKVMSDKDQVIDLMRKGCNDPQVQTAYGNLADVL